MERASAQKGQSAAATPTVAERPLKGAAAAQAGYDYQVDVSILAAIRLLLISKAASRLVLEPANEEDLEADLAPHTPGRVQPSATVAGGYKLVIQVKLRSGEPWSIEDFKGLLKHGAGADHKSGRRPALHHLDDPQTRYLLVTSAAAKGVARDLLVEGFEEVADKEHFPKSLKTILKKKPEGRVGIWAGLTEKQLASTLRETMSDLLHVPRVHQQALLDRLRSEAKRRTRGSKPGIWTREDLLATIREHGGFLASSPNLESFVPPANFDKMVEKLNEEGAVVLRGPSGTGKTQAALKLCELARERDGTLEVVTVGADDSPSSTRKVVNAGPTLFYVDDPWGQYSLRGGHESWTEQLPRLLGKASADHQFVITSRSDMMQSAKVGDALNLWSIELDAKQYGDGRLGRIYDGRMDQLPPDLQSMAYGFRREALERFETPLEVDLFFTNMQVGPLEGEKDHDFFQRLLKLAQRGAVRDVVEKTLEAIDKQGFGAVIWAILAARSQFDRGQLTAVQRVLRRTNRDLGEGLERVVDRLVAARHLRQPSRVVSFAHPSVRQAFEFVLLADWPRTEGAIGDLIAALVQLPGTYRDWGMETAARALQVTRTLGARIDGLDPPFDIDRASHNAIDAWLDESLAAEEADFRPLLELASDVGTEASIPSEVARWLLKGVQRGGSVFIKNWSPPAFDDRWYARISGDVRAGVIAARFVREVLPWDRGNYGRAFAEKLDRIATGLTPAFLDAAGKMVGNGFEMNADAVAQGAIRDLGGFEPVLQKALDDLGRLSRRRNQEEAEEWRAIEDGERDHAVEEGFQSHHEDDGYTSGVFVDGYISRLRSENRWQVIAEHPRVGELGSAWARAIATSGSKPDMAELEAAIEKTTGTNAEHQAWWAAREHWQLKLSAELERRLIATPSDGDLRDELALCALLASPESLVQAIEALTNEPAKQITLLVSMHSARTRLGSAERSATLRRVIARLAPDLAAIATALPTRQRPAGAVGNAPLDILAGAINDLPPEALEAIVPIIVASGGEAQKAIECWLVKALDKEQALKAAEAAVRTGQPELVGLALRHRRADARRVALLALAPTMPDPLPSYILRMASDPGSRVRSALVSILRGRPHPEHLAVLLTLTGDTWSSAEPYHDEPETYAIAQEAIVALSEYGPLPDGVASKLLDLAERTPDRLLSQLSLIVAAHGGDADIRERIWTLTQIPEARWIRLDALEALAGAEVVEPSIVNRITAELLLRSPAVLAAPAAHLLGRFAPAQAAVETFERLASSNKRRALLLVGAAALADRDGAAARKLLNLLEPGHPARELLDAPAPLDPSVLDDLGKVRLRSAVRRQLGDLLAEPETSVASP
jgi:hypothetical protein